MFWRGNPLTGEQPAPNGPSWPRNGALLTGNIHSLKAPVDGNMYVEIFIYSINVV
jgi:hypothetical protein